MSRWSLEMQSTAAGLVTATLVAGLIALAVRLELLNNTESARWAMVILGPAAGLWVGAQYLKSRGID